MDVNGTGEDSQDDDSTYKTESSLVYSASDSGESSAEETSGPEPKRKKGELLRAMGDPAKPSPANRRAKRAMTSEKQKLV